jgi:dephospho-CoA kinase
MLKVGLTGGIASGKSMVAQAFARLGAKVLDADKVAREVVLPGQPAWRKLQQAFGPQFFLPDGEVNRSKLRRLVFADPEERSKLNAIVHPEVMKEINCRFEQLTTSAPDAVVVVDVPLLLEVGVAHRFDRVIVVYVTKSIQIERLRQRDGLSLEEARRALSTQMVLNKKVEQADYVIDNSGTRAKTQAQVEEVWAELIKLARNQRSGEMGKPGDGDRGT